jgi:hypothetical protein
MSIANESLSTKIPMKISQRNEAGSITQTVANGTKIQLVFHLPKTYQSETQQMIIEVSTQETINENHSFTAHEKVVSENDLVKLAALEKLNEINPFISLKLKNPESIYKIGTSYVSDIQKGYKHFGFANLTKQTNDLHLLAYGSFINYSLKKSVLIIVRDLNDKSFDKYRMNFTPGTLWNWRTSEWGNVCLVDYKQIFKHEENFNQMNLELITHEFSAVLWALPAIDVQGELKKAALPVLGKMDCVTFVTRYGDTRNEDLKKSAEYYKCFNISLKGVIAEDAIVKSKDASGETIK